MSSSKGWIKLHRSLREHWVWDDPVLTQIWIDILFRANHKKGKVIIGRNVVTLEPGQFFTSLRKLSAAWNMNKETVKIRLSQLEQDGMIKVYGKPGFGTIVTVCNYGVFQGSESTYPDNIPDNIPDNDPYNDRTNIQTEIRHKQEDKEYKEQHKNEKKKKAGLPPGDSDRFEEVL